jgi:hypothetical protein
MIKSMETPWERLWESFESAKDETLSVIEDLFQTAEATGTVQSRIYSSYS